MRKTRTQISIDFPGCNLSPLFFSLFVRELGPELNSLILGITLDDVNCQAQPSPSPSWLSSIILSSGRPSGHPPGHPPGIV